MNAVQALLALGLPIYDPYLESRQIFDGLEEFRQHLGGRLTLTMLRGVGSAVSVHEVDNQAMEKAVGMLREIHEQALVNQNQSSPSSTSHTH
jgi:3-dehydroquinate synthase